MTDQNKLEAYKLAIQLKFDDEKNKYYSNFLLKPSRANLRNLCLERMKDTTSRDDLNSFTLFLGFEFSLSQLNKLKAQKDKFRPIETFFKRETDLSALDAIDMAAILVDFQPRPFKKYLQYYANGATKSEFVTPKPKGQQEQNEGEKRSAGVTSGENKTLVFEPRTSFKKKVGYGFIGILGVFGGGYTAKDLLFPEKQCMKWVDDHYVMVDCLDKAQGIGSYELVKPFDSREFERKELNVCDTTIFFVGDKPKVWYSKKNNVVQFFNMDGVNPENDAELRKISEIIIEKYVEPCD